MLIGVWPTTSYCRASSSLRQNPSICNWVTSSEPRIMPLPSSTSADQSRLWITRVDVPQWFFNFFEVTEYPIVQARHILRVTPPVHALLHVDRQELLRVFNHLVAEGRKILVLPNARIQRCLCVHFARNSNIIQRLVSGHAQENVRKNKERNTWCQNLPIFFSFWHSHFAWHDLTTSLLQVRLYFNSRPVESTDILKLSKTRGHEFWPYFLAKKVKN